jgi:hypothetical protein
MLAGTLSSSLPSIGSNPIASLASFGVITPPFQLEEDVTNIPALQPELRDQSQYYTSLVNGGVITPNEAREAIGFDPIEGNDELRVPANIAGSAANPDEGGAPAQNEEEEAEAEPSLPPIEAEV